MRLRSAAGRFDNTLAEDAYDEYSYFYCQLAPLDLYKIDGTAVKRRQMSSKPDVVIPQRHAIRIEGQVYLIGDSSPDHWGGRVIRKNYVLQGADHMASLYTIAQALSNSTVTQAYASLDFNKNMTDERESSDYKSQYNIFLSGTESVAERSLIKIDTRWFYVHQAYVSVSGLFVTLADELDAPVFETVSYGTRTYDPVTDSYSSASSSVNVLRLKWTEHFRNLSRNTEKREHGDMQFVVLKSAMPTAKASDTITMSDGAWVIRAVQDDGDTLNLHVRRN